MSDATTPTPVTASTLFDTLKGLLTKVEDDYAKARSGNQAAGTRVRSVMQEIRKTAKTVRDEMLEFREKSRTTKPSKKS